VDGLFYFGKKGRVRNGGKGKIEKKKKEGREKVGEGGVGGLAHLLSRERGRLKKKGKRKKKKKKKKESRTG